METAARALRLENSNMTPTRKKWNLVKKVCLKMKYLHVVHSLVIKGRVTLQNHFLDDKLNIDSNMKLFGYLL